MVQKFSKTSGGTAGPSLGDPVVADGDLLWVPGPERVVSAPITRYLQWLRLRGRPFTDYHELWRWSADRVEDFWASIWEYFGVLSDTPYESVLERRVMPGARWFTGARVNYAEHVLRHEAELAEETALHYISEGRSYGKLSWGELGRQVRILATRLRAMGLAPGDRVVSYMPNAPETAVAMLATTAIGAIWSSAAPEFGAGAVLERFRQIGPRLIFVADGYVYHGKTFLRGVEAARIVGDLPTLEHVVWLPFVDAGAGCPIAGALSWHNMLAGPEVPRAAFRYERVAHDHPLWVLFSSGTTGLPKAIVHSHVGILVELLKLTQLQLGLQRGSVMFFHSTTGWVMWNILLSALLAGAAAVLYDGDPMYPGPELLWQLAERTGTTSFGVSPTYVKILQDSGFIPGECCDLVQLDSIVLSGSPATSETYAWLYARVKRDLWVNSISGGTELCSALVGGAPILPVHAGEIQGRALGMDVHAWDEAGCDLRGDVGELVVRKPSPSMPLRFWNDADDRRYLETYFDVWPGVWRHGDFIRFNENGGCHIHGRSDSTLNRYGVRIGTAEIYRAVEKIEEVADSLIVCCELSDGGFFMPLFVQIRDGAVLDQALCTRIQDKLRRECSPRHVPDRIIQVPDIPYTLSGKKMEVPVRRILMGWPVDKAASREAMKRPDALEFFITFKWR
ncbi:acetoacetate--CoA ligase [Nevskia soli]|uniref:acetoacetate--CoA ligase n=1 Tax=Nevskia soli TaxID=418856 RepID=UPI0009FCD231|nr:acetoacetate--CoA ligase [Nevskia soli]